MLYQFRIFSSSSKWNIGTMYRDYTVDVSAEFTYQSLEYFANQCAHWQKCLTPTHTNMTHFVAVPCGVGVHEVEQKTRFGHFGGGFPGSTFAPNESPWRFAARIEIPTKSSARPAWVFHPGFPESDLRRKGNRVELPVYWIWRNWVNQHWYSQVPSFGQYIRMTPHGEPTYGMLDAEPIENFIFAGCTAMNAKRRQLAKRVPTALSTLATILQVCRELRYEQDVTQEYANLVLGPWYLHSFNEHIITTNAKALSVVLAVEALLKGESGYDSSEQDGFLPRYGPTGEHIKALINKVKIASARIMNDVYPSLTPETWSGGTAYYGQLKAQLVWESCKTLAELTFLLLWFDWNSNIAPGWSARFGGYVPKNPDIGL